MLACLFLFSAAALANGPAWIAELSDTSPDKAEAIEVTIPVGSHVALGVYNTDAVRPIAPEGIETTVRILWSEQRTVFVGWPGERESSVPYYLPKPGDCTPTGSWVVELKPASTGTFAVPIECNTNTVTANVQCIDLPASDIGYGFYTDNNRYCDPTREREYDRDMVAHGMNTFTPYAYRRPTQFDGEVTGSEGKDGVPSLVWAIDTAIEEGLCDARFPILCLASGYKDLSEASAIAKHEWPELLGYGNDEPAITQATQVAEESARWHETGRRTGTAINGLHALEIGTPLDVWVLHMDSITPEVLAECKRRGKEFWMYNCSLRGSNAAQHRYWTGVYTWALRPRVCLTWAYMHQPESRIMPDGTWNMLRYYGVASADAQGHPIPTVALEGMGEGVIDSRLLQELQRRNTEAGNAYLDHLRKSVPLGFWTSGHDREYSSYVWDVPDTQVPPIDCHQMRSEVLKLLSEVR